MKRHPWTHNDRRIIYDTLVDEFGPRHKWANKTTPGDPKLYKQILNNLSQTLGAGPGAIKQQINFVLPPFNKKYSDYMSAWIRNVSAALESGFIRNRDLPNSITLDLK